MRFSKLILAGILLMPLVGGLRAAPAKETAGDIVRRFEVADTQCRAILRLAISPDGRYFAYTGQVITGQETLCGLWLDSSRIASAEQIPVFQFTSSGQLWFVSRRAGRVQLSFAGKAGPEYERINLRSIISNPEGTIIAYAGYRQEKWYLVTQALKSDGTGSETSEGKAYDGVGIPCFADDGRTVIYPARLGNRYGSATCFIVTGTREGKRYQADYLGWVKQSPDGKKTAFIVAHEGKAWVVVNERADTKYDDVGWLQFIPGTSVLVYVAQSHGQQFLVRDRYPLRDWFDQVSFLNFSPDGQKCAFVARTGNRQFVVVNGRRGSPFEQVLLPQFSPNSRRLAYRVRDGNRWAMVIDGRCEPAYDEIREFVWSRDSREYAYCVRDGNRWQLRLPGSVTPDYDEIVGLQALAEGGFRYAARQGRTLLLLTNRGN